MRIGGYNSGQFKMLLDLSPTLKKLATEQMT
jgi:hypothetical protein